MSIEQQIKALFEGVLKAHDGNSAAAARQLETNTVTFWGWLNGTRGQKARKTLFHAIDLAGGHLVIPDGCNEPDQKREVDSAIYAKKCESLEREVDRLHYELAKMEGRCELLTEQLAFAREEKNTPHEGAA